MPMVRDAQSKLQQKIRENMFDSGPAIAFLVGLVWWSDTEFVRGMRSHFS